MSSVSSFEGSDKDSLFHKSFPEGQARHSYLRKTDLLDTLDINRARDTDTWSVAATIDDQESVISSQGAMTHLSQRIMERDMDESAKDNLSDIQNTNSSLLRELVEQDVVIPHHLREDDEDKRSRSNAAEFGDDGARSATADFHSITSDDDRAHNVVDDQITAPPQPQPSFAVTKSFEELMEENDMLQVQLREMQETQKQQEELIMNLRDVPNAEPIVNKHTLMQKLTQLQEMIGWFVKTMVDEEWSLSLEQSVYMLIAEGFLSTIPFGTNKHALLNTAYADQMSRFQTTLGTNLSKWYRKQTIQSLLLNAATKEYLNAVKMDVTNKMEALLSTMPKKSVDSASVWQPILELSASLSLELHQGNNDVRMEPIEIGCTFNDATMVPVRRVDQHDKVTMIVSPLFVDEEQTVLLRAKVVLG